MKKILLSIILCVYSVSAQIFAQPCIPNPPYPSSVCGAFNVIPQVISVTPICYIGNITVQLTTGIIADSILIKTGDGHEITLFPNTLTTLYNYTYNLTPPDSCANSTPLSIVLEFEFFKCCGSGFSYQWASTSVSVMFLPRVHLSGQDSICSGQNFNLNISGCHNGFTGHPATVTFDYKDGSPLVVFNNITTSGYPSIPPHPYTAGIYWPVIEVTNDCGTRRDSLKVVVAEITSVIINPATACTGVPVSATVNAINGGGYNVTVSGPGIATITDQHTANPQFTFPVPGTYTLHFTLASPPICPVDCTVTVAPGPAMSVNHRPDECYDGTNTYNFSNFFNSGNTNQSNHFYLIPLGSPPIYQAILNGTIPNTPISLPGAGTYIALDSSFTQCPGSVVKVDTFYVLNPVILPVYPPDSVCKGTTLILPVAPSGVTIYLNNIAVTTPGYTFNSAGMTYNFIYTPAPGCGNTSTYTVYVYNAVNLTVNNVTACVSAGTAALSATPSGGTFSGNYVNGNSFNVAASGTGTFWYYYSYTDTTGCIYTDSATVTVNNQTAPVFTAPQTICEGTLFTINVISGPTDITIDGTLYPNTSSASVLLNAPGTYYYNVAGSGACGVGTNGSVYVQASPNNVSLSAVSAANCGSAFVTVTNLTPSIPNATVVYTWPDMTTTTIDPPPPYYCLIPFGADSAQFTFTITVSTPGCQSVSSSTTITLYSPSAASFSPSLLVACPTQPVSFVNTSTNSGLIDSCFWYINGVLASTAFNLPAQTFYANTTDSVYSIKLIIHNKYCNQYDSIMHTVLIHPVNFPVAITLPQSAYCPGTNFTLTANALPSNSVVWWTVVPGNLIYYNMTALTLNFTTPGIYTITLHVQGCILKTTSATVRIYNDIPLGITTGPANCSSSPVSFGINSIYIDSIAGVHWVFPNGVTIDTTLTPQVNLAPGSYPVSLTVTSNHGCQFSAAASVTVSQTPQAVISLDSALCQFSQIRFADLLEQSVYNPGDFIRWIVQYNDSVFIMDNTALMVLKDTGFIHCMVIIDNGGCKDSAVIYATIKSSPHPEIVSDRSTATIYDPYFSFKNESPGLFSEIYDWQFGDGYYSPEESPRHGYLYAAIYTVTLGIINSNGCKGEDSLQVEITGDPGIYVPNAFTPGGLNPVFLPVPRNIEIEGYTLSIFNRWGEKVFSTSDQNTGWNGRYKKSKPLPGVYVWVITYRHKTDVNQTEDGLLRGTVTLVK